MSTQPSSSPGMRRQKSVTEKIRAAAGFKLKSLRGTSASTTKEALWEASPPTARKCRPPPIAQPYLLVVENGENIELRGSAEGLSSSHLFQRFGMAEQTSTKGKDMGKIKLDYFSLLEKSGFFLVSSSASSNDSHIVREYIFRKHPAAFTSSSQTSLGSAKTSRLQKLHIKAGEVDASRSQSDSSIESDIGASATVSQTTAMSDVPASVSETAEEAIAKGVSDPHVAEEGEGNTRDSV